MFPPIDPLISFPEKLAVLRNLVAAFEYHAAAGGSIWEFALARSELGPHLTSADLRWLLRKRYAMHARESTRPGSRRRSFDRLSARVLPKDSVWALTASGYQAYASVCRALADPLHERDIPYWDLKQRKLWFRGELVKQLPSTADNQEAVLTAFQENRWLPIGNPLATEFGVAASDRLHDAVRRLNERQLKPLLVFTLRTRAAT